MLCLLGGGMSLMKYTLVTPHFNTKHTPQKEVLTLQYGVYLQIQSTHVLSLYNPEYAP